jgi:hypothetical protein
MLPLFLHALFAVHLGPMAPDAPARSPQMAAGGSMVALTFGAGNGIYFSSSHDNGETFSAPVKVTEGGVVPLSRHRGPHIALSGNTIVISAIAGRKVADGPHAHGLPADGDLFVWRSTDGGKSWSKGTVVNDSPGAPTEGLHSLAADTKGSLFVAWLDQRTGMGTQLYGARSTDAGSTWSSNVLIYQSPEGTICQCCSPSAAIDASGRILVMWRNCLAGARDMYLVRSRDGLEFSTPEKLGTGTWQLNACPMDGGGLAVTAGRLLTAWRRGENVFFAVPGQPETQAGVGKDVALALSGGRTYLIWSNGGKIQSWIDGKVGTLSLDGAFPALTSLPRGGVLAAWEENGGIRTRRLP